MPSRVPRRRRPLAACLLLAALTACSRTDEGPRYLSIGTAPPGGAFFVVGGALAEVLSTDELRVTAEATKGSLETIRRIDRGELELGLANASITYFAVRGDEGWDRPHPMRSLMTLAHNVMLFVTPSRSGIETIRDLEGRRVVVGVAGAGWEYFIRPMLRAHGIDYDHFTPLHNTQAGAVDMLKDGSADAAFLGGAVPTASIVQAVTSLDVRFVPFDADARRALVERFPFYFEVELPPGTYPGVDEPFQGLSFGSMQVLVHEGMEETLAYELVRRIYESAELVAAKHPAGRFIRADNVARETGTPFHPGAVRYFRETAIWPDSAPAP